MDCTLLGKYHVSVIGVEAVMIRNHLLQRRTGGGMTRFQQAMVLAGVGAAIVSSAAGLLQADTILKNETVITVEHPLLERGDLWVTAKDLERINGLALKPPGVLCLGDVCINLSQKGDNALLRKRDGQDWVNVTGLAQKIRQPFAADPETKTWSFGPIPETRTPFLKSAVAPNFELPDRKGKIIRLSDYRGKKVLLLTWASWCGCRLDVRNWEPIYERLKDRGFEMISVAEDTGGEAAAGPTFDAAHVTFVTIIDPHHTISALFNFVNVPSAAWIDEQGHIVRINEGTYAKKHSLGAITFGSNDYAPAVEDWVRNGSKSKFAWSEAELAKHLKPRSNAEQRAQALFQLGVYFSKQQDLKKAKKYFAQAEALDPNNWNIHRQDWALTDKKAQNRNWLMKVTRSAKPYYAPLDLPK
jgi:peroxiredoxin